MAHIGYFRDEFAEHEFAAQSKSFDRFSDNVRRKLLRALRRSALISPTSFGWHANGYGSFAVEARPPWPTPLHRLLGSRNNPRRK